VTSGLVVAALAALNVVKHALPPGDVALSAGAALGLLAFARRSGLTWEQLGLGRDQLRSGGVWALAAVLLVSGAYVAGVLLPATRGAFLDSRYQQEPSEALLAALVVIPVGTVLLEEVAFRSVLWGMLRRHSGTTGALVLSSALFGLWHVLPSLDFASSHPAPPGRRRVAPTVLVSLGTVAFTAIGGAVAAELRRRSGSVVASAGMHWATNGLGALFALAAWRLERRTARAASNA
jgi:membrane protease YdiL (CAAX protease family)